MCPYRGEAFKTYEKAFPFSPYAVNKVYLNGFGVHVFVNKKGYLHALVKNKVLMPHYMGDHAWQIIDCMLTTDNMLKQVNQSCFYKTEEECNKAIINYTGVDEDDS